MLYPLSPLSTLFLTHSPSRLMAVETAPSGGGGSVACGGDGGAPSSSPFFLPLPLLLFLDPVFLEVAMARRCCDVCGSALAWEARQRLGARRGGGGARLHPTPSHASVPRPSGAGSTSPGLMEDESVHRAPSPPTAKHCHLHPAGCQIRPPQGHGTQIRPPSVVSFIPVLWPPPPVTGRHICQPLGAANR